MVQGGRLRRDDVNGLLRTVCSLRLLDAIPHVTVFAGIGPDLGVHVLVTLGTGDRLKGGMNPLVTGPVAPQLKEAPPTLWNWKTFLEAGNDMGHNFNTTYKCQ